MVIGFGLTQDVLGLYLNVILRYKKNEHKDGYKDGPHSTD